MINAKEALEASNEVRRELSIEYKKTAKMLIQTGISEAVQDATRLGEFKAHVRVFDREEVVNEIENILVDLGYRVGISEIHIGAYSLNISWDSPTPS